MSVLLAYLKKLREEFQKIKFPTRNEVIAVSFSCLSMIFIFGFFFYIIDLLSWLVVNRVIIGL